jgi:HTH-type transcriptional regulator / antitoxin HigA
MLIDDFCPDWVSPPGDTISDILIERDISTTEFAKLIGCTTDNVNDLLQGRATITIEIARKLEKVLGASVEFWMSRDFQYRKDITRLHSVQNEWLDELPIGDMIKYGWLSPIPHPKNEVEACLRFFDVSSVQEWEDTYDDLLQMTIFKTSPTFESRPAAVAAWLRQGEIVAEYIKCNDWDANYFQKALVNIRSLTRRKNPSIFIPELEKYCADSGVALVVLRAPTGCRASGATRFLSRNKALLMLSFRFLTDDHFWFTFFHEAGHLLLHDKSNLFLEGVDDTITTQEREANKFAESILIPPDWQETFLNLKANSSEIIRFAVRIGIAPGIVVGQLQHYGKLRFNQLNSLKRPFRWER